MHGPNIIDENLYYIKICLENIFAKTICSTHQKKCFSKILGIFGNLNFWRNIDRPGSYINGESFVLSQKMLRKYFLSKLFLPLIKGSVSPQFKAIFGKKNLWRNIDRRRPYKNGENKIMIRIKLWPEKLPVIIICSTSTRKCFSTILGNVSKIEFFT